ncbi:hypothetical protein [Flavobacterium sp.]|uniref:hypothetical protein n=1 Tax=Flavobacterium sp. TaxID=239 RepID=UPI003D6A35B0
MGETNYIFYQKEIAKVEAHTINGNYKEAVLIFNNLLSQFTFIFPRDAYLAAQLASFTDQKEIAVKFLIEAIKSGSSFKILLQNLHIRNVINDIGIVEFEKIYFQYRKKDIPQELKQEMLSLYHKDNEYLTRYSKIYNIFHKKKILTEWDEFSLVAGVKVREIIRKTGFPSYKILGTENSGDYKKGQFKDLISSHLAVILLAHDQENNKEIMIVLLEELKKGNINARTLAFIRDIITYKRIRNGDLKQDEYDLYAYGVFSFLDKNTEEISSYNKVRSEIGLCDIEIEKEKHFMNKKYKSSTLWYKKNRNFKQPFFHFFLEDIC